MLMKYRVICGSVTVTGPPRAICRRKVGITLPRLPRTLPNRTAQKTQPRSCALRTICSANHFDAPMTLAGRTALSVEISTNRCTPVATAASTTFAVPSTLVWTASSRMRLEDRHVLVRGGVEDDLGPVPR